MIAYVTSLHQEDTSTANKIIIYIIIYMIDIFK